MLTHVSQEVQQATQVTLSEEETQAFQASISEIQSSFQTGTFDSSQSLTTLLHQASDLRQQIADRVGIQIIGGLLEAVAEYDPTLLLAHDLVQDINETHTKLLAEETLAERVTEAKALEAKIDALEEKFAALESKTNNALTEFATELDNLASDFNAASFSGRIEALRDKISTELANISAQEISAAEIRAAEEAAQAALDAQHTALSGKIAILEGICEKIDTQTSIALYAATVVLAQISADLRSAPKADLQMRLNAVTTSLQTVRSQIDAAKQVVKNGTEHEENHHNDDDHAQEVGNDNVSQDSLGSSSNEDGNDENTNEDGYENEDDDESDSSIKDLASFQPAHQIYYGPVYGDIELQEDYVQAMFDALSAKPNDEGHRYAAINISLIYYIRKAKDIGAPAAKALTEKVINNGLKQPGMLQQAIIAGLDYFDFITVDGATQILTLTPAQRMYLSLWSTPDIPDQTSHMRHIAATDAVYSVLVEEAKDQVLLYELEIQRQIVDAEILKASQEATQEELREEARRIHTALQCIRDRYRDVLIDGQTQESALIEAIEAFGAINSTIFDKDSNPNEEKEKLVMREMTSAYCELLTDTSKNNEKLRLVSESLRNKIVSSFNVEKQTDLTRWMATDSQFMQNQSQLRQRLFTLFGQAKARLNPNEALAIALYKAMVELAGEHLELTNNPQQLPMRNLDKERSGTLLDVASGNADSDALLPESLRHANASPSSAPNF